MPALDLALGLRVVRRATDMGDALALEPPGEVAGDVGRAIVTEQAGPVDDPGAAAARSGERERQAAPRLGR